MGYVKIQPRYDPLFPKDFYDQFYDFVASFVNSKGQEVSLESRLGEEQPFIDSNGRRANNKLLD